MPDIEMMGPWITELEHEYVNDALANMNGPKKYYYVEAFEHDFAALHGREYCLMTPTCTAAIHLALDAIGIGHGDHVIVPNLTWVASAVPAAYVGAELDFVDVAHDNWCADTMYLTEGNSTALIAVDLAGNMPDYDSIAEWAERNGAWLIEDAAQGIGSVYHGQRAGSFGIASVFSFHRTKTLSCFEGGCLLTDDDDLYRRAKILRYHGQDVDDPLSPTYWAKMIGYKYTPSNISAALLYAQLKRFDELVGKKRYINQRYRELLSGLPVAINGDTDDAQSGAWVTCVIFKDMDKDDAMSGLSKVGVPSRPMLYPLTSHPAFYKWAGESEWWVSETPNSYWLSQHGIMLPGTLTMTDEQIEEVASGVRGLFN